MKHRTALAFPLILLATVPAFAQAPAAAPVPAPQPAPVAPPDAAPAPVPDAAATVAAPLPPPVAAEPVPSEPASVEEKAEPAPADKVTVAKNGFFQPSATLQVWAVAERLGTARTDENAWQSGFRIRRAEIKAKGEIIPKTIGYSVMFDPARLLDFKSASTDVRNADGETVGSVGVLQPPGALGGSTVLSGGSSSLLQDVELTFMSEFADVSIGQFKIPVSYEGYGSASKLLFPERSLVSRRFGDRRDIGLKITKKFDYFSYYLGVFNGEGQNNLDTNDQKDLALRLEAYPIKGLTLAVVGYTSVGDRKLPGTKDRIEGDIRFEKSGLLLQAEAIRGWDVTGTAAASTKIQGQGFYVTAGYTFFDKLQPMVRIGSVDPEVGKDENGATAIDSRDEITAYEFGVNYYLKQHDAKLQLAGSFFDPEQRVQRTTFDLILAAQVSF
jgi:hypothetical protein